MTNQTVFTLVNSQNGNLAFKLFLFVDNRYFDHIQRNNYYSLIWLRQGTGKIKADFSTYDFKSDSLFTFSLYQPFMFSENENISGVAIQFHPDFSASINIRQKLPATEFCSIIFISHLL